jgi:hypothetical protein
MSNPNILGQTTAMSSQIDFANNTLTNNKYMSYTIVQYL